MTDQIGKSVHDAAMKGGEPNPVTTNLKKGLIGNYPMFEYNHDNTPMPGEEHKVGDTLKIDPKAIKAASEKRENEAAEALKEERLKEAKEPKIEGIEANRVAYAKKMEEAAKKDKITPPISAPAAAPAATDEASLAQRR